MKFISKELTADHRRSKKAQKLVEQYDNGDITEEQLIERLHEITTLGEYMDIPGEMIEEIKQGEFERGVLTHSNALQFRFNYNMAVGKYSDKTEDIVSAAHEFTRGLVSGTPEFRAPGPKAPCL